MSRNKVYLLPLILFVLVACTLGKQSTPLPNDETLSFDLLIDETDMPPGWIGYEPFQPTDDYCLRDCAVVQFVADTVRSDRATHYVFVYDNPTNAIWVYKTYLEPRLFGETPLAWTYVSEVADDFGFACYQYINVEYPLCSWIARYGRCDVDFSAWLAPGRMSLDDFSAVVQIIDQKMFTSPCFDAGK
jgi:hypothetical protein